MSIFNDVSAFQKISSRNTKWPGSHSRSDYFWLFNSLGNRILSSVETAGLPFENDLFPTFRPLRKFRPEIRKVPGSLSRSDHFLNLGAWEGLFSPLAKRPNYRSQNYIFADVSAPEKFSLEISRTCSRSLTRQFWTFRSFGKPNLASGETAGLSYAKGQISSRNKKRPVSRL